MNLQLFKKHSLSSMAKNLELTPFDIVLHIGRQGGLKSDLSFERDTEGRFYHDMQLESWWDPKGEMAAIIQAYPEVENIHQRRFQQVCAMLLKKSGSTRLDNLSRGFSSSLSQEEINFEKQRITIIVLFLVGSDIIHVPSPSIGCRVDILQPDALEQIASGNIEGFEALISTFDASES